MLVQRWGQPPGAAFGQYPFGVTVLEEETWGGVNLPARFCAGWWWGTPREAERELFRARLTGATYA